MFNLVCWVFMFSWCKICFVFLGNNGVGLLFCLCDFKNLVIFGVFWIIY